MEEPRHSMTKDDIYSLPSLDEAPWLILTHTNYTSGSDNQTFCLMNTKSYIKAIVELDGKSILASNQGWLILQERVNRSRYSVWNPVTRQCLSLPELLDSPEEELQPQICMFTSPPDGDGPCVVLLFFENLLFSCRLTMGDDYRWVKQSLEHDGQTVQIQVAAAVNGDIYVNAFTNNSSDNEDNNSCSIFARIKVVCDCSSNLVLFEPLKIQLPCGGMNFPKYSLRRNFLLEVCGVLYAVHIVRREWIVDSDIVKAYVWRLDFTQMKWIQVESLGDRAFLLWDNCCAWCWANASCSGVEGNCIYITRPWTIKTMHQYRLQDDSCILLNPNPNILQTLDYPIWFMPRNPTRLSPVIINTAKAEDTKNIKHVEELEEMKMYRPTTSFICQLPSDMLISITKYLHLFDYMNLRTTCKILRSNIPRPQWRSNCSYPLFMSVKNTKSGICELWDPMFNSSVDIIYHRAGNDQWEYGSAKIEFDFGTGIEFACTDNSRPMYHDGAFYFLSLNCNLGVLKMVDEKWSSKVHKGPILDEIYLYSSHLAELNGQLISVFIKEDTLCNDWVALDDLGDYMLFVSPASSFSVSTKDNSMRNRIYLPKRIGNEMVYYSLSSGMYHTSSNQHPSKDFYISDVLPPPL